MKKKLSTNTLLVWYCDPLKPGSLGGLTQFVNHAARIWNAIWGTCCINPEDDSIPSPPWWSGIDEQWKVDQIEVINIAKYNRGYRYLLTVVDVFSKLAWVQRLKNKTGQVMMDAFQKILKGGRQLMNLQTDDGKEFYNKMFQALTKWKGIHHFSSSRDTKASVVKRFNQTLKKRLSLVPIPYHEEHITLCPHLARSGARIQSILPPQYQEDPEASDSSQ